MDETKLKPSKALLPAAALFAQWSEDPEDVRAYVAFEEEFLQVVALGLDRLGGGDAEGARVVCNGGVSYLKDRTSPPPARWLSGSVGRRANLDLMLRLAFGGFSARRLDAKNCCQSVRLSFSAFANRRAAISEIHCGL